MGLLAPLYALAALAVAGPILFHLIRRQPQGQQQFSSLMFLQPSPPTLTRRSRVDQWLLLLLRALAIALIAIAFARPYFREESLLNINLDGRNLVMLLDTSASMQRADVWQSAQKEMEELLSSLSSEDRVSLYTIDRALHAIVPLEGDSVVDPEATQIAVQQAIATIEPTWFQSELAEGLTAASDMLSAAAISGGVHAGRSSEIVLFTDLHEKSGLEALQGYPWPEKIGLDVRRILPSETGNSRPSLLVAEDSDEQQSEYRVRIENNEDSETQTLQLEWANARGSIGGTYTTIQVPPGQVRVVPMTSRPADADRVRLSGDAWQDDNDVFIVEAEKSVQPIAFIGRKANKPEEDLGYFLQKAPLNSALVEREVSAVPLSELQGVIAEGSTRTIVLEPVEGLLSRIPSIREFAEAGGTVLAVLSRPEDANQAALLQELLDTPDLEVQEAETRDFALIGWLDYKSPVFSPFADPRFNDFSKIRFWNHRQIQLPDSDDNEEGETQALTANIKTVAKFDDLTPLLLRQPVGEGNIWVLSSGWQPTASGLALSSKFLPILTGLLDPAGRLRQRQSTFEVGESIPMDSIDVRILNGEGEEVDDSVAKLGTTDIQFFEPGIYSIAYNDVVQQIAIQVPSNESQLVPQDKDVFEQYGIKLGKLASDSQRKESARQMQIEELEKKQRLWQWLIVAGLTVLALETLLGGWFAKRNTQQVATA